MRTFLQWFALILPILFVLLPHKVIDRCMWVRSHIFSCALTSFSLPRFSNFRHIRDLLIHFQVPEDYPWEWHQRQSVVYLRVSMTTTLQSVMLYIGATSDTVQRRESARRRIFIQLVRKKLSHYEPAWKVFHRQRGFYKGVLIALRHEPDGLTLLATEAALIREVRPQLNGCYEKTQDQAGSFPNATSQDRTA